MLDGVHLTLWIGPGGPVPAPPEVLEALDAVQVQSGGERSAFQLSFKVGKNSLLQTILLPAGYFDPIITRVIIIATVRGLPSLLMDGVITRQELSPSNDPGKSTLTVTGEDLSMVMDLVEMPFMRFPAQPVITRVYSILAKYAGLGIAPIAIPPIAFDTPNPLEAIDHQVGTDREYLQQLAAECGYVFFVEPGPFPGSSIAYFGPDYRIPSPQPALNVNMDAHTNVESLSFSLDGTAKSIFVMTIKDPGSRRTPIAVAMPDISMVRPPLGARPTLPARVRFTEEAAHLSPTEAANLAISMLLGSNDAITGSGSLDVQRYGQPLRARMMVGVRGAGLAYDGLYFVNTVTHDIKRGQYKQSFTRSRDGLVSQTPVVPP